MVEGDAVMPLRSLPQEVLLYLLSSYSDCSDLENVWYAASSNKQHVELFWILLNRVIDVRIAQSTRKTGLRKVVDDLVPDPKLPVSDFSFRQRLNVMSYAEQLCGVLWCGYMEFKDPLLPDLRMQTVKVMLRTDEENWSWNHTIAWNHSFSHTIKLVSQVYNFVPIRPRGLIFGVTPKDRAVLRGVSCRLQSRDQVMTLRFSNSCGFILRIVSPTQAHQRLARFGGSPISHFETTEEALVCSWECPPIFEAHSGSVLASMKHEAINGMVEVMKEMSFAL